MRWLVFITSWILVVVSQDTSVDSWKSGSICDKHYCLDKRGHFNQQSFLVTSDLSNRSFKLLYSFVPTNFVVYIRNIKNLSQQKNFLQICGGSRCDYLNSAEDQIFALWNIRQVTIVASKSGIEFEVQYYAGCNILDQLDVDVQLEADNHLYEVGRCWILIPRLYDGSIRQKTAASNIFLSNVNLPPHSALSVSDILTGKTLMNFSASTDLEYETVEKGQNEIPYQIQRSISSVFLLTVDKCPSQLCSEVSFKMHVQVMSEQDLKCFRDKQVCDLDVTEGISCDNVKETACSSYHDFENMKNALSTLGGDGAEERGFAAGKDIVKKCHALFKMPKYKNGLCGGSVNCKRFGQCNIYCLMERKLNAYGICSKSQRFVIVQ